MPLKAEDMVEIKLVRENLLISARFDSELPALSRSWQVHSYNPQGKM